MARRAESYLPLDPSVPPERLRRLLSEAKVDRILTQDDRRAGGPSGCWPP
ncbi:hypothetical protein ACFV30_00245 [Streptomyces sp. NPDC059752]